MKKLLTLSTIVVSTLMADTILPYVSYLNYNNSIKKNGIDAGIYAVKTINNKNSIEINTDYLKIDYESPYNDYYQKTFGVGFNYTSYGTNVINTFRIATNNIWHKQNETGFNSDRVWAISLNNYLIKNKLVIKPTIYYSIYDNDFKVVQPSLTIGKYYVPDLVDNDIGYFYFSTTLNYIKMTKDGYTPKNKYINVDLSVSNTYENMTSTLTYSIGKNAYKVKNGGFVVYNLGDEYKYTISGNLTYRFTKKSNVNLGIAYSKLSNLDSEIIVTTLSFTKKY